MCLSNAYRKDDHSLLMSNTSRIEVDGDIINKGIDRIDRL